MRVFDFKGRISLLIPTASYRQEHFLRVLNYLVNSQFNGDIVVVDFGKTPMAASFFSPFHQLNIKYQYNGSINYFDHILVGAQLCQTELLFFHPDDDFVFMDVLSEAVDILEKQPDVSVVQGKALKVKLTDKTLDVGNYQVISFDDADPLNRLIQLAASYNHQMYVAIRKKQFINKMTLGKAFAHNNGLWQYWDSAISVIDGKSIALEKLGFVRVVHQESWGIALEKERNYEALPYMLASPHFSNDLMLLKKLIVNYLNNSGRTLNQNEMMSIDSVLINLVLWGSVQRRKIRNNFLKDSNSQVLDNAKIKLNQIYKLLLA